MNIKHGFLFAFAITIGIISYYDITKCKRLPWPPRFIAAGLAFAMMDLFSFFSEELAGLLAIGIVLAALVQKGFVSDCPTPILAVANPTNTTFIGQDQPAAYQAFQSTPQTLA